ncbi:hypothetical protein [Thermus phage TSP4]|nr:hypothetical protein [Thermus phage TSP4]
MMKVGFRTSLRTSWRTSSAGGRRLRRFSWPNWKISVRSKRGRYAPLFYGRRAYDRDSKRSRVKGVIPPFLFFWYY